MLIVLCIDCSQRWNQCAVSLCESEFLLFEHNTSSERRLIEIVFFIIQVPLQLKKREREIPIKRSHREREAKKLRSQVSEASVWLARALISLFLYEDFNGNLHSGPNKKRKETCQSTEENEKKKEISEEWKGILPPLCLPPPNGFSRILFCNLLSAFFGRKSSARSVSLSCNGEKVSNFSDHPRKLENLDCQPASLLRAGQKVSSKLVLLKQ